MTGNRADTTAEICSARAGDGLYGITTREIREVLGDARPRCVPLAPHYIAGVLAYRGEVLTAVSLRALLGMAPHAGTSRLLVLEDRELNEPFGLLVDEVGGISSGVLGEMERNPAMLAERDAAIFDGLFRIENELMARLDVKKLTPLELARCGLFATEAQVR